MGQFKAVKIKMFKKCFWRNSKLLKRSFLDEAINKKHEDEKWKEFMREMVLRLRKVKYYD